MNEYQNWAFPILRFSIIGSGKDGSIMFLRASYLVFPWEMQPGISGTWTMK